MPDEITLDPESEAVLDRMWARRVAERKAEMAAAKPEPAPKPEPEAE